MQGAFKLEDRLVVPSLNRIEYNGGKVHIEPKMMQVLLCLVESEGKVVGKEELIRAVWADTFVTDDVLKRCISELRKALGDNSREPRFIETIPKGGYRLVASMQGLSVDSAIEIKASGRTRRRFLITATITVAVVLGAMSALMLLRGPLKPEPRVIPLTTLPGAEAMTSFSPDGSQIVFNWSGEHPASHGVSALYVKVIGTETQQRLTEFGGFPAWSPDGRQIAFHRLVPQTHRGIFAISPLGGPERKLTDSSLEPDDIVAAQISWSPDGRLLAFSDRRKNHYTHDLFVLDTQTFERKKVDVPPDCNVRQSAYSPDGSELAYTCEQGVFVRSAANGKTRATGFPPGEFMGLTWSADGKKLIASRFETFTTQLWEAPAAGGEAERLPYGRGAWWPAAARRGDRLAFTQWDFNVNIWRLGLKTSISAAGTPAKFIASSMAQAQPQYSPDGKKIVFTSTRSGSLKIWTCDSAGSSPLQLTSFESELDGSPRWSPDGKTIAFDAKTEAGWDIYLVDVDGGAPRKLSLSTNDNHVPSWSHDSHWIYYSSGSGREGSPQVFKARATGGQAIQITRSGGDLPREAADGKRVFYQRVDNSIWSAWVEGGDERPVPSLPAPRYWNDWTPTPSGIYVVRWTPGATISFYDFASRRTTDLTQIPGKGTAMGAGLALSPDGKWLLFTQVDSLVEPSGDLMMIENYR